MLKIGRFITALLDAFDCSHSILCLLCLQNTVKRLHCLVKFRGGRCAAIPA